MQSPWNYQSVFYWKDMLYSYYLTITSQYLATSHVCEWRCVSALKVSLFLCDSGWSWARQQHDQEEKNPKYPAYFVNMAELEICFIVNAMCEEDLSLSEFHHTEISKDFPLLEPS